MLNYDKMNIDVNGNIKYTLKGKLHRLDGPALITTFGDQIWYKNGKKHNDNGPAAISPNNVEIYYKNGKVHRENGPAMSWKTGEKCWYINGLLHNNGHPAIIYRDGSKCWYKNGLLHRENGPAIIIKEGPQYYYKFGIKLNSVSEMPILLATCMKYSLYYHDGYYYEGGRKFSRQEGLNYWGNISRFKSFYDAILNNQINNLGNKQ